MYFYLYGGLHVSMALTVSIYESALRRVNNHNRAAAQEWQKLANAVDYSYGHKYQKAIDYLHSLMNNSEWNSAELAPLPWHAAPVNAAPGNPFVMHQAVLNALAPSLPLRAVFSRN